MLILNLKNLLKLKGRSDARIFLMSKLKLSYSKARKLTNGSAQFIWFSMIEDLCEELECKITDLFEYIPDKGRLIPGLVGLIRDPNMRSLAERLENKSAEEIKWLMQKLDEAEEELRKKKKEAEEEFRKKEEKEKGEGPVGG
jgi:DNA-binding Xre family transcriptional regulator